MTSDTYMATYMFFIYVPYMTVPYGSGQISPVSLLKCGFTTPKIAETGNLWYKFVQKGYTPLSDFYKIWLGEDIEGLHPRAKLCYCRLKMWEYSPQNRQNWYFCINLPKRGIPP